MMPSYPMTPIRLRTGQTIWCMDVFIGTGAVGRKDTDPTIRATCGIEPMAIARLGLDGIDATVPVAILGVAGFADLVAPSGIVAAGRSSLQCHCNLRGGG